MTAWPALRPTVVQDDFFADPDAIRSWALTQRYYRADAFNRRFARSERWPGQRCAALEESRPDFARQFVRHIVTRILRLPRCECRSALSFQLTMQSDGDSWVHQDDMRFDIAGLVFLSPNPPKRSGTVFYRRDRHGQFETVDVIGNRYGRMLLFDSQAFHKSDSYFGDSQQSARLTMPFFLAIRNKRSQPDTHDTEASL